MTPKNLLDLKTDEKILLVGIGTEILQFLSWLTEVVKLKPNQICLADKKENPELPGFRSEEFDSIYFGENYLQAFTNPHIKYIFKAPGIWSKSPEFEDFRAKNGQQSVLSSLVFFINKYKSQIIGITGTKGKSTTSSLVQHFLVNSGYDSKYCGNTTGISPYQFWTDLNQEIQQTQKFVIELSSFQLQDLGNSLVSPDLAIITNYYVDHQDQHHGTSEYWLAKDHIYLYQRENGLVVASPSVLEKSTNLKSKTTKIITDDQLIENINSQVKHNLIGKHNQSNLAQSLIIVESLVQGTQDIKLILEGIITKKDHYTNLLQRFQPLAHRIQLIRTIDLEKVTINFYDDGAATEPDAVAAAVKSLTEKANQFLWLQLTGTDPGPDLTNLISTLKEEEKMIYKIDFCGKIGQRIYNTLYNKQPELNNFRDTISQYFTDFETEIEQFLGYIAGKNFTSKPTLQIVLSPCGKSFDEFQNYLDRCNWWVEQVKSIKSR